MEGTSCLRELLLLCLFLGVDMVSCHLLLKLSSVKSGEAISLFKLYQALKHHF